MLAHGLDQGSGAERGGILRVARGAAAHLPSPAGLSWRQARVRGRGQDAARHRLALASSRPGRRAVLYREAAARPTFKPDLNSAEPQLAEMAAKIQLARRLW